MKKKRIAYHIPEPCHESWEQMTPVEKGRFCSSCTKPVIDFTRMTDLQVQGFMNQATGSVCGRMSITQLNREFTPYMEIAPRAFSLHALVLGTALTTFSACEANAQRGEVIQTEQTESGMLKGKVEKEPVLMGDTVMVTVPAVFSGKVFDYLQNGFIAGTSVTLYDEAGQELASTISNEKGEFEVPLRENMRPYKAVFRKEEYVEAEYLFADLATTVGLTVTLYQRDQLMMGKVIQEKR